MKPGSCGCDLLHWEKPEQPHDPFAFTPGKSLASGLLKGLSAALPRREKTQLLRRAGLLHYSPSPFLLVYRLFMRKTGKRALMWKHGSHRPEDGAGCADGHRKGPSPSVGKFCIMIPDNLCPKSLLWIFSCPERLAPVHGAKSINLRD